MSDNQLSLLRVLIVDDEKTIQRLVLDVLLSLGFKDITTANSGRQAIELVSNNDFDFIITDWFMADMDGIDLVRFIRKSPESCCPSMPIIMLTGNTELHDVKTAVDTGIDAYLIKPFSAAQLVQRIRRIIEHPRPFVLAPKYRGPDRRHTPRTPPGGVDRRNKPKK